MNRFDGRLDQVFAAMGVILLVWSSLAAACLRNPPPPSSASDNKAGAVPSSDSAHGEALRTIKSKAWVLLWIMFFCNITAGLMFIGFQSPMIQELLKAQKPGLTAAELAGAGATLIGLSALCNALGRLFWGGLSDRIGRARAFRIILATQVVVFLALPWVKSPWGFGFLVCYVLLCYGGGFGTMPSLVVDRFGLRLMPMVYGGLLTAWSIAGVVGPQLAAFIRDHYPGQAMRLTFGTAAILLSLGLAATAGPGFDGQSKRTD
jgi:OFA family oxalate/formate antiporter-like MFS transporter